MGTKTTDTPDTPHSHAYGLRIVHCPECGAHIASQCPLCEYESRYDEDHREGCPLALQLDLGDLSVEPTPEKEV
ncbi:MAG: hypothetical protein Kow0092_36450 [Deferrisomatales bacterium]